MKNCQIYRMYVDVENCATYQFNSYKKMDYWDDYLAHYFKGKPLPQDWKMPKYELGAPNKPLHDFVHGESVAPFISERVKTTLEAIAGESVQFWPIGKIKNHNYFILNVINIINCLNEDLSEISYAPDIPNKILGIWKAVFDIKKIPENTIIFKVPQETGPIYVTDTFVQYIRQHQLTGVGFEWPHDVGLSRPKNVFPDLPLRAPQKTKNALSNKSEKTTQSSAKKTVISDAPRHSREEDIFYNKYLGFKIFKPADWEFVPTEWTLSFRKRMDPDDEELQKVMKLARMPFVALRYNHNDLHWAYPTVQITCRPLESEAAKDHRAQIVKMQCEQLKKMYTNIDIIDASSEIQISGFPASRIISKFSIFTNDGKEFKCLSQTYTVYVRKLGFTIGMSGPSEGPYERKTDFTSIFNSITIE